MKDEKKQDNGELQLSRHLVYMLSLRLSIIHCLWCSYIADISPLLQGNATGIKIESEIIIFCPSLYFSPCWKIFKIEVVGMNKSYGLFYDSVRSREYITNKIYILWYVLLLLCRMRNSWEKLYYLKWTSCKVAVIYWTITSRNQNFHQILL